MSEFKSLIDIMNLTQTDWAANDERVRQWEAEQAETERRERYRKQAPERYWTESLATYKTDTDERKKMKDKAELFCHAVKCGKFATLAFLGSVGTGKTHLALGIIYECGGLYRLSSGIVEEIRRAKSFTATETEAKILEQYGRASLLVIDEIGRGVAAQDEQYMLYQIINERYNRRKSTVLISNQSKKDFLNYIGIAAADRLTESAQVAEFTGLSYRATIRRENVRT